MIASPILDIMISMVFVYFLFSMLASSFREIWASYFKSRGEVLRASIKRVLDDPHNKFFGDLFYTQPSIDSLSEPNSKRPSYIESRNFAQSLIEMIVNEGRKVNYTQDKSSGKMKMEVTEADGSLVEKFQEGIKKMNESDFKNLLQTFTQDIDFKNTITSNNEKLSTNIEQWFNGYMDRVSGWYKRDVKISLFWKSLLIALLFNVNFFVILKTFYFNNYLREIVVSQATTTVKQNQSTMPSDTAKAKIDKLYDVGLPTGWNMKEMRGFEKNLKYGFKFDFAFFKEIHSQIMTSGGYIYALFGWLISAVIMSFGAPFWFDVLKKLVNMRQSGIKPKA